MNDKNFCSGFTRSTISQLYAALPIFFDGMGMLITCLDSDPRPADLTKWLSNLAQNGIKVRPIGRAAWIDRGDLSAVFAQGKTFFGFDEIYLLAHRPKDGFSPAKFFTADRLQLTGSPPVELLDNIRALDASRYVSDGTGIGLNFICDSNFLRESVLNVGHHP